jgi:hypothetical protein
MIIFKNTRHFNNSFPEVEIDIRSLNIIPLFDIINVPFELTKNDSNPILPKNKTAIRILHNKNLIYRYSYSSIFLIYSYEHLKSKYIDFKERIKNEVYSFFNEKVNFITTINNTNIQFNEKVFINTEYITNNFQFRGNNQFIKNTFDKFSTKKVIRNNEKLAIYYGSVFKEVTEGTYPVLLSGIDANKINSFKSNLINTLVNEPTDFNSVKVYVDKDWYLDSCNKSLKIYLLKNLEEKYYNYELILFDGKEFANQNMFSYQPLSFSTLGKRKKYFNDIEAKLYELMLDDYNDSFDYKVEQEKFLNKYNQLLENNRKEKQDKEESKPEILETRSLTSEEMSLIDSLFQNNVEEETVPRVISTNIMNEAIINNIEYQEVPVLDLIPVSQELSPTGQLLSTISEIDNTFAGLEDELRRIANEIQNG